MGGKGSGRSPVVSTARKDAIHELFNPSDGELSVPEWLSVAKTIPEVKSLLIIKYVGGSWSRIEDLDTIGPGFKEEGVESYIASSFKDGRYRIQARGDMGVKIGDSPVMFIGSWEETEAKARDRAPAAAPLSGAAGVGRKIEERVDAMTSVAILDKMENIEERQRTEKAFAPMQMAMSMMDMFQKFLDKPKGDGEGIGVTALMQMMMQMQQSSTQMMIAMIQANAERAKDGGTTFGALSEIVKILDTVRESFGLDFNRGEGEGGGWKEGVKMALPLLQEAIHRWPGGPNGQRAMPGDTVETTTEEGAVPRPPQQQQGIPEPLKRLIEIIINALKSRDYRTADAIIRNLKDGGGKPLIDIDPEAQPIAYASLLAMYDVRFMDMEQEIAGYFDWLIAEEEGEPEPAEEKKS